jgi:hypothetical protein
MKCISRALAAPGDAWADLHRLTAEAVPEPLPESVETALHKLRPYEGWEVLMRGLMRTSSTSPGDPNPMSWASSTAYWHASALKHILSTAHAAGLSCETFSDLQQTAVLDALEKRLGPKPLAKGLVSANAAGIPIASNATPLPKTWGGLYLRGILCSLRTCLHASKISCSTDLKARIDFHSTADRRPVDERLFSKEVYLTGAAALDAYGRISKAAGYAKGSSIRTGARLLAVAADGAPRRGELGKADRRLVHSNVLAASQEVKVFIPRATSKARRTRILLLRDPRAIRLILDMKHGAGGYELFRQPDGQPFKLEALDYLLRRVTTMAVGKPASYNMLRRANARAQGTTNERSMQLGRSLKSTQTNVIYNTNLVHTANTVLVAARKRARAAAEKAGYV